MRKIRVFEQKLQVLCTYYPNFDLSKLSTIKIGGKARYYAQVHSTITLRKIIVLCNKFDIDFTIVGNCSNILFLDTGFNGVVIHLNDFDKIKVRGNVLHAQAGASLASICRLALKNNLSGLEWTVGIPASVGGAIVMNAGAFNGDISSILKNVQVLDTHSLKLRNFGVLEYFGKSHESVFTNNKNYVILNVDLVLCPKPYDLILDRMRTIAKARAERQNVGLPSLGSIFRRGDSEFAPAYYIEQLGLKGTCIGDAQVSRVHSGYIVNLGDACAKDVLTLIGVIQRKIFVQYGVRLKTEIIIVGE